MHGLQVLAAHLRLLPERDPHVALYRALAVVLDHLDQPAMAGELLVRFELMVLEELGFGLDLSSCAATGRLDDLAFVSPRSGRAVSRQAGEPWRDRMLALPGFLSPGSREQAAMPEIEAAFHMTGFFLHRHVYEPRGLAEPEARSGFLAALRKHHAVPTQDETAA